MGMQRDIERVEQRAKQYWYDDGLTEIAIGVIFIALGGLFLAEASAPPGSPWRSFSAFGMVALVAGGMWLAKWAIRWAKNRITFPRTGYVRYRKPVRSGRQRLLTGLLGAGISLLIVAFLGATAPASRDWLPVFQGMVIGAFVLYMGYQVGVLRFYFLAAFSVLAGLGAYLAGMGDIVGNGVYFISMGVATLLSGVATLIVYLRSTEPAEGE